MSETITPDSPAAEVFHDAAAAVARLEELYTQATGFLCTHFAQAMREGAPACRVRAFYPQVEFETSSYAHVDTRLSFGHVSAPGRYRATITRPDLFRSYLTQQIGLLIENHGQPVTIGPSETAMPVHFAVARDAAITVPQEGAAEARGLFPRAARALHSHCARAFSEPRSLYELPILRVGV